jgi:hypothetical protein
MKPVARRPARCPAMGPRGPTCVAASVAERVRGCRGRFPLRMALPVKRVRPDAPSATGSDRLRPFHC